MRLEALLAIDAFNVRKLSKACNFGSCRRLPTKQAVILEVCGRGSKEIIDIYFCEEHYTRKISHVMKKLNSSCEKGTFVEKRVFDIGYVTY